MFRCALAPELYNPTTPVAFAGLLARVGRSTGGEGDTGLCIRDHPNFDGMAACRGEVTTIPTRGDYQFHDLLARNPDCPWTVLMTHPKDYTPVRSGEWTSQCTAAAGISI